MLFRGVFVNFDYDTLNRAYYKRIPGHPMGKREWWVKFVFIIFKLELDWLNCP